MDKKKWYENTYWYEHPHKGRVEKAFYDVKPEDAFYLWKQYNMRINLKRVNLEFWKMTELKMSPYNYFAFLRAEGYREFVWPHEINSGKGFPEKISDMRRDFEEKDILGRVEFKFNT